MEPTDLNWLVNGERVHPCDIVDIQVGATIRTEVPGTPFYSELIRKPNDDPDGYDCEVCMNDRKNIGLRFWANTWEDAIRELCSNIRVAAFVYTELKADMPPMKGMAVGATGEEIGIFERRCETDDCVAIEHIPASSAEIAAKILYTRGWWKHNGMWFCPTCAEEKRESAT